MIIKNDNFAETLSTGIDESTDMGIDKSDEGILQMILSEGLYSDPIGSLVREYTSNALDANREVQNDEPILVSLKMDDNKKWWFKVQDFGVGISPERVKNIVTKYGASTKRGDDTQLGFFGLGMKSGLAYGDSVNIETIYDGIKYMYIMYKGERNTKFDLINSFETEEGNGTTISIALKESERRWSWDSKTNEVLEFIKKIKEQLAYFEGVYFDVPEIDNEFEIISTELWKHSSLVDSNNMHICLDNVYYPIDWEKLGVKTIAFPVALNFKVTDGLIPTPNREQLRMTPTMKELIKDRIKLVADEFIIKYNETVEAKDTLAEVWKKIDSDKREYIISGDKINVNVNITALKNHSDILISEVSIKGAELLNLKQIKEHLNFLLCNNISGRGGISGGKYSNSYEISNHEVVQNVTKDTNYPSKLYAIDAKPSNLILDYLKSSERKIYFVHIGVSNIILGNYESKKGYYKAIPTNGYYNLLGLKDYPKEQWREVIQQWLSVRENLLTNILDISSVVPDAAWLQARKDNRSRSIKIAVSKEEIYPKKAYQSSRRDIVFSCEDAKLTTIEKFSKRAGSNIYFTQDQKTLVNECFETIFPLNFIINARKGKVNRLGGRRVNFYQVSTRDYTKLQKAKPQNSFTMEEFMKGDNRIFSQMVTAYKIKMLLDKNDRLLDYKKEELQKLSSHFMSQIEEIKNYQTKHLDRCYYGDNEAFLNSCFALANANNLWDTQIIDVVHSVEKGIKIFAFLNLINTGRFDEAQFQLAVEVLKNRKVKLDWQNYVILNDLTTFDVDEPEEVEPEGNTEDEEEALQEELDAQEDGTVGDMVDTNQLEAELALNDLKAESIF